MDDRLVIWLMQKRVLLLLMLIPINHFLVSCHNKKAQSPRRECTFVCPFVAQIWHSWLPTTFIRKILINGWAYLIFIKFQTARNASCGTPPFLFVSFVSCLCFSKSFFRLYLRRNTLRTSFLSALRSPAIILFPIAA